MAEEDLILNVIEKRTGNALDGGANDLDRVAGRADHAGESMHKLGSESGFVDSEIARLSTHIRDLGGEINRTGNTSLFKDIKSDKSQLKQFENLAKSLVPVGEEGGKSFSKGFLSSMGELGSGLRGLMIPIAVGTGAALAPLLGAVVAAAVTGAVGLGGIAGGIAMAAKDNAVRQSARLFGQDISAEFFGGGRPFVAPIIESLGILRDAFSDMDLGGALAPLASVVTTIAEGLAGFGRAAMPGLIEAFQGAVPVLEVFAEMLPEVGAAFGGMLSDIVNSQGSLTAMRTLMVAITGTLQTVGNVIQFLTTAWDGMVRALAAATGALEDIGGPLQTVFSDLNNGLELLAGVGPKVEGAFSPIPGRFRDMSGATNDTTTSVSHLTMSIDDLKTALDELFDKQMDYDQAILAVQKDTVALKAAVASGTATLNTNTQAGVTNKGMILDLIRDYERQRDASIKMGTSTAAATRKFDDQVGALGGLLSQLGFSKSAVDRLLSSYRKLHDAPNIQKEIRINVTTSGQTGALSLIGNVGKVAAFAEGGWVKGPPGSPQMAIVHGGEFVLSQDMLKNSAMPRSAAPGAAMATSSRIEAVWMAPPGVIEDAIGEIVRRFVHFRGGDPVAALAS
jgi:hypothetical protein